MKFPIALRSFLAGLILLIGNLYTSGTIASPENSNKPDPGIYTISTSQQHHRLHKFKTMGEETSFFCQARSPLPQAADKNRLQSLLFSSSAFLTRKASNNKQCSSLLHYSGPKRYLALLDLRI